MNAEKCGRGLKGAALVLALSAMGCSGADARSDDVAAARVPVARIAGNLDTVSLQVAFARAAELPRLRSLLVHWKDTLVAERYYGGATRGTRANIKSASKGIVSALVGIAIGQGRIDGIDQTIGELLPVETRALAADKRAITVEDLLSMRAGLQSTSFDNYGSWVSSRNWVRDALARPMVAARGDDGPMIYSTGNTHLLSAIITRRTGVSTYRFAERHLARPLGIALRPWQTDPQGIHFGGNDMYLMPRDMLKIGRLYLNRGVHAGKQIVPRAWIDSSLVSRTISPWNGNRYGYGWWTRSAHGVDVHYAWGYGGQFIFIVPALELVVVMTSESDSRREWGHNGDLHRILEDAIIPAVSVRQDD